MSTVFYITVGIVIVQMLFLIQQKRFPGTTLICILGIYLPMFLYFANWSEYIKTEVSSQFYYIFIIFNICLFIYNCIINENKLIEILAGVNNYQIKHIGIIVTIFVGLYLIESYVGSGTIFPARQGIDIHAYSAPILSFITRSMFVPFIMCMLGYIQSHKKRYIFYCVCLILLPMISRNARMVSLTLLISVAYIGLLWLMIPRNRKNLREKLLSIKISSIMMFMILVVGITILVAYSSSITNSRTINNGADSEFTYSNSILYTGPELFKEALATYYGYYPLSFANLNLNLQYSETANDYLGMYSYCSIWFGIFQFDNLFSLSTTEPEDNILWTCGTATVPTGFWTFWYEYGYLCVIPIGLMFALIGLSYKALTPGNGIFIFSLIVYLLVNLSQQSFQNVFFAPQNIWTVLLLYMILKGNTAFVQKEKRDVV